MSGDTSQVAFSSSWLCLGRGGISRGGIRLSSVGHKGRAGSWPARSWLHPAGAGEKAAAALGTAGLVFSITPTGSNAGGHWLIQGMVLQALSATCGA